MIYILTILLACTGGDTDKTDSGGEDTAPQPFACGEETCDARTQYCYSFSGGAVDTSGEGARSQECMEIPAECLDTRTCACLEVSPDAPSSSGCQEVDGAITLMLEAP